MIHNKVGIKTYNNIKYSLHLYMFLRRSNIQIYYMRRIPSSYSYEVQLVNEYDISSINNALRNKDCEFAVVKSSNIADVSYQFWSKYITYASHRPYYRIFR